MALVSNTRSDISLQMGDWERIVTISFPITFLNGRARGQISGGGKILSREFRGTRIDASFYTQSNPHTPHATRTSTLSLSNHLSTTDTSRREIISAGQ